LSGTEETNLFAETPVVTMSDFTPIPIELRTLYQIANPNP